MGRAQRVLVACIACIVLLLAAAPAYAAESHYTIDELSTELVARTDGSAHVIERQVLTFAKDNTGVVWYLHVPESGESVRISSVRVVPVDDGGTPLSDWTTLQMIDSDRLQQGRNPGDSASPALRSNKVQPWYSYNIGDGMVRCYFPLAKATDDADGANGQASNSSDYRRTYAIEVDYTIAHRIRVYRDVAELYWRYANDSLPADSSNVNLQIVLPAPEGEDPTALKDEIRAWGHGPNEGVFSIGDNGTVTYHIDRIDSGNYAEAHVVFPASWMTDMAPNAANSFSDMRGSNAAAEEAAWVDSAQREAAWDNNVRVLFLILAVVIIVGGVIAVLRFGRSPRSRRVLVRIGATLAIVALAENLFFREPLTTLMLVALAAIMALAAFMLPLRNASDADATEEGGEAPGEEA